MKAGVKIGRGDLLVVRAVLRLRRQGRFRFGRRCFSGHRKRSSAIEGEREGVRKGDNRGGANKGGGGTYSLWEIALSLSLLLVFDGRIFGRLQF